MCCFCLATDCLSPLRALGFTRAAFLSSLLLRTRGCSALIASRCGEESPSPVTNFWQTHASSPGVAGRRPHSRLNSYMCCVCLRWEGKRNKRKKRRKKDLCRSVYTICIQEQLKKGNSLPNQTRNTEPPHFSPQRRVSLSFSDVTLSTWTPIPQHLFRKLIYVQPAAASRAVVAPFSSHPTNRSQVERDTKHETKKKTKKRKNNERKNAKNGTTVTILVGCSSSLHTHKCLPRMIHGAAGSLPSPSTVRPQAQNKAETI